jgi:putative transposase
LRLLVEAYRGCVNRFIKFLWQIPTEEFGLDAKTLAMIPAGRLSERYKSQCLKQAIEIVVSTRRAVETTGQKAKCPKFRGDLVLDAKFVIVENKETCPGNPFDLVIRLSTLKQGRRTTILSNRTKPLNKWLNRPGARLVQGCSLSENSLTLWIEEPEVELPWAPREDAVLYTGDLGMRKLFTIKNDKDQTAFLGSEYWELQNEIRRKKPNSNARKRALRERDHLIGCAVNALPWGYFDVFGLEDLKGITRGKGEFGKEFRRKRSPWAHRQVLERVGHRCQENRVLLVTVPPAGTSRECPNIKCRCASALNRRGELFRCAACGHTEDADGVGAGNIRLRTLRNLDGRRRWLNSHPDSPNKAHSVHRRSVASRRVKKPLVACCN